MIGFYASNLFLLFVSTADITLNAKIRHNG